MADREKFFDAIRNCVTDPKCKDKDCPWKEDCEKIGCKRTTVPVTLLLDALELLKEQQETLVSFQSTINKLTKALAEQPEQKHGHWISYGYGFYRCSVCNDAKNMNFVPNYCSTCGAKMDEKMDNLEVKQNETD